MGVEMISPRRFTLPSIKQPPRTSSSNNHPMGGHNSRPAKKGDCILSMTDSTTSKGWARKTNFSKLGEEPIKATIRIEVAQKHAMNLLNAGVKDYSQWFPGAQNEVADALSRDGNRSDEELTRILKFFVLNRYRNTSRLFRSPARSPPGLHLFCRGCHRKRSYESDT